MNTAAESERDAGVRMRPPRGGAGAAVRGAVPWAVTTGGGGGGQPLRLRPRIPGAGVRVPRVGAETRRHVRHTAYRGKQTQRMGSERIAPVPERLLVSAGRRPYSHPARVGPYLCVPAFRRVCPFDESRAAHPHRRAGGGGHRALVRAVWRVAAVRGSPRRPRSGARPALRGAQRCAPGHGSAARQRGPAGGGGRCYHRRHRAGRGV